jgi:hypothetical protein
MDRIGEHNILMAHFAELDENNIVLRVIVVPDEHELYGELWCNNLLGGRWKQTSYNGTIRKNYAGAGYTYDTARDAFVPPQPYPSWVLDAETCQWQSPVAYPDDGLQYAWDEAALSWVLQEGV